MLVILGIREKNIDFTRALKYQDLITLSIKISNSWKGEDIKKEIDLVKKEIGHIKYAVADMGNALKKGLRISSIYHVVDITHKISWFIKQLYSKEERFISYTKKLAHLRGSIPLSKLAYILPPTQRVHSRYMNLKPIVDWGNSIIHLLKSKKELKQEREKLGFVKDYKKFLKEIDTIITFAIKIQKIIKNKGLSKKTIDLCEKIFSKNQHNEKIIRFKEQIMGYLKETLAIEQEIKSPKLLCTSDILESCFGKYKSMINSNKSLGITDLCLTIAAITSDYRNEQEIFNAMKNIRTKEVIQWKNKNIGKTLLARRREVLKKSRV